MHLYLIDGTYELFRAHFGSPSRRDREGREVGATLGLMASLLALLRDLPAVYAACAFDHVIESFRNEMFEGYKTSEGVGQELLDQFDLAEEAASALGLAVWPMTRYEADDALATAVRRWKDDSSVDQVVICSPDKDFTQLVVGEKVVCLDRRRGEITDERKVRSRFGVHPESVPDWLALVGDSADGFPGIAGWGGKSAGVILGEYGHLEEIPPDPREWRVTVRNATRLAEGLRERWDEALLYRDLATLRSDVDLKESLNDLEWRGVVRDEFETILKRLGDSSLQERVPRWQYHARPR